ncbi:MAG: T9SS type A sorting domain-containing protein [Bacteroidales bacterium]|nr:T9SS type A sorting domain-containing protein [Bacteroidales bacterium]
MKRSILKHLLLTASSIILLYVSPVYSQNYVEIGSGNIQNSMPIYSYWNYSWSSLIYHHADLGDAKTITAIGLNCVNGPKTVTNQKIYVKQSSIETFPNASYEDPLNNGYVLVYEGSLTFQTGWNLINLTTPIVYDGVQNLVFHWENRWNQTYGPIFTSTASTINNNKNCGSDVSFPGVGSSGYLNPYPSSLTNTRFYYASTGPATPFNPIPADDATRVSVDTDLSWELGSNTPTYDLYFGTDPQGMTLIGENMTAVQGVNQFALDGLLADSTRHFWQVIARNGSQQEMSPVWEFKTEVVIDEFPYSQGFEDSTVFNTYPVESAWIIEPEISWYEYDVNAHSGLLCAKSFYYNSQHQAVLMSPKVLLPAGHRITYFWANEEAKIAGHDTTYFEVSSNGGQSWTVLDFLSPNTATSYVQRTQNLNDWAGNNFFFRFRHSTDNTSGASSVFLDDITIEPMSMIPAIELSTDILEFRELYRNGHTTDTITITNTGSVDLQINSISVEQPFSCNYSGVLQPTQSVNIPVLFTAGTPGTFSSTLTVNIEGPFTGNPSLEVTGTVLENNAELFEAFDLSNNLPVHWNKIRSSTETYNDVTIVTSSFDSHSIPNVSKILNANDSIAPLMMIMPGVSGFGDHELSFYAKKGGEFYDLDLIVGLMDDPYNAQSFEAVHTLAMNPEHTRYTVSFPASTTKPYIAFRHGNNGKWSSLWIDDVIWTNPSSQDPPNPAFCAYPADNATAVDIMMPEFYLIWSNGGGNPEGYRLSMGTDNPPTNMLYQVDLGDTVIFNLEQTLSYNTVYYWQIVPYNNSGDASDCPVWSFVTMADPTIDQYPVTENFDNLVAGSAFYYPPFMMGNIYPLGWTVLSPANHTMSWTMISNNASNPENAYSAPNAMHMGWSFLEPMDEWLITPPLVMSAEKAYALRFFYKTANLGISTSEKLEVLAGTAPSPEAMTLGQLFNNSNVTNTDYLPGTGTFSPPADGVYYFAFHGYSDPLQFLLFMDDLIILETEVSSASQDLTAEIQVFPNPAEDKLFIRNPGGRKKTSRIEIGSVTGSILMATEETGELITLDTSSLKAGVYMLRISSGNHQQVRKIVIR